MKAFIRGVGGLIVGVVVSLVLITIVELFSDLFFPLPKDHEPTRDEICLHVQRYPTWILAVVVPAWMFTAYVGTWVATRVGNRLSAMVLASLLVLAVALNLSQLPYAVWFKAATLVAIPLGCALALRTRRVSQSVPSADTR